MELNNLMQKIANNAIPKFMIWFGEELEVQKRYLMKICVGYEKVILSSCANLVQQLSKKGLADVKKCFVIYNDFDFTKAETKWENIISTALNSKHIVILRYDKLERNKKFFKRNKELIVEFNKLGDEVLKNYIWKELYDFEESNCAELIKLCGNNYGRVLLEINKIKIYAKEKSLDVNQAYKKLLNQNSIYNQIGDITFELTDAVLGGWIEIAREKLKQAKLKQESPILIASVLYTGFYNLIQYQIDKKLLGPWQQKQCQLLNGGYSMRELKRNLKLCQRVESYIKIGKLDQDLALDYLILGCFR